MHIVPHLNYLQNTYIHTYLLNNVHRILFKYLAFLLLLLNLIVFIFILI